MTQIRPPSGQVAGPVLSSTYTRGNFYADVMLPFSKERWELSMQQAMLNAKSEEDKIQIAAKNLELISARLKGIDDLQAKARETDKSEVSDSAKEAIRANDAERLERFKAGTSAMRVNAETGRTLQAANIQAEGVVRAAGQQADIQALKEWQASLREQMAAQDNNVRDVGSWAQVPDAVDQVQRDVLSAPDPSDLHVRTQAASDIQNLVNDAYQHKANSPGFEMPYATFAKSVGTVADPSLRSFLTRQYIQNLKTGQEKALFEQLVAAQVGDISSLSSAEQAAASAKLSAMSNLGSTGMMSPDAAANFEMPRGTGDYDSEALKRMGLVHGETKMELDALEEQKQRLQAQQLSILDQIQAYKPADLVQSARNVYATNFPGPQVNLPKFKLPQFGDSYVPPSPQEIATMQALQPPLHGSVPPAMDDASFLRYIDATSRGPAQQQQLLNVQPPALQGTSQEQLDRLKDPVGPAQQNFQMRPPPKMTPATGSPSPATSPGLKAAAAADELIRSPSKAQRLLANDPVARDAEAKFNIDQRSGISAADTVKKVIADYQGNPEKQERAIKTIMYLTHKKITATRLQPAIPTAPVKKDV